LTLTLPKPRLIDPASVRALKWGIVGTGIGAQFAGSIHEHTPQRVLAIAARDTGKTELIAQRLGIPRAYSTTTQLIHDAEIDAVYISTPHPLHRDLALEAIAEGKHVLVEKPIAMSAADARLILDAGRSTGVFVMEAMWTRYLPQSDILRQILADGLIGDVRLVRANFGPVIPYTPAHRMWSAELGGGALLDAGIYPITLADMVLGSPERVVAAGTVLPNGVDVTANIMLTTKNDAAALLATSLVTAMPASADVAGSGGRVQFREPFFAPTEMSVVVGPWGAQETAVWRHELPQGRATDGYAYEATAFASCVGESRSESPLHTHDETVAIMATIDEIRRQLFDAGRLAEVTASRQNGDLR
jgi:predicted dehydrogenase